MYVYVYIAHEMHAEAAIEIPSSWRKHQYLHQLYSRFSNLRSYVRWRVLHFTDIFYNILIAECFAFFYVLCIFRIAESYAYCLCQNHTSELQNWLSSVKS